jgi:Spy/CpxP family protein refolding chaperone
MRRLPGLIAAATFFAVPACNEGSSGSTGAAGSVGSTAAPLAAPSGTPSAPKARGHHGFARHAGIAAGLFHAAQALDLTAVEQEGLAKIETSLRQDDDGVRAATGAFRSDLVAGVRAGKLDTAKLVADEAAVDQANANHLTAEASALESLHALLDAKQRAQVVSSVQARAEGRDSRMTAWMDAKAQDGGMADWGARRRDKLTADLGLDASQAKQLAALFTRARDIPDTAVLRARWEDRNRRADALLTAFTRDTFDAKTLDLSIFPGKSAREPLEHQTTFVSQLLPLLHADQHDKLAAVLERPFGGGRSWGPGATPDRGVNDDFAFPFVEPVNVPEGGP